MKVAPPQFTLYTPHGRVIPDAPLGILGGFIQEKLSTYIEPQREGTPKGQAVGLSRPKYHCALLTSLTALSLKRVAQIAGAPLASVKKWRTEESFIAAENAIRTEFSEGIFDRACVASWLAREGHPIVSTSPEWGDHLADKVKSQQLIGFDDAAFYDSTVLFVLSNESHDLLLKLLDAITTTPAEQEPTEAIIEQTGQALAWIYALDQIDRLRQDTMQRYRRALTPIGKWHVDWARSHRARVSRFLTVLIRGVLKHRPVPRRYQDIAYLTANVLGRVLKD